MINLVIEKVYGYKEGLTCDLGNNEIINWPYDAPKPSKNEINQMLTEYKQSIENANKAKNEMPTLDEKIDAIFEMLANNDSTKLDKVKAKVATVKQKYGVER